MTRHSLAPLSACSVLALATAMVFAPAPARAQSFQGTGNFVTNSGGAANIGTGTGTTTINLNPGQTIIDWTPSDNAVGNFGAINFQPSNTTATFNSSDNFAVLNRINVADPTRIVAMGGTINSTIGGQITGGSVFFYSPSGFVLTGTSSINVGSLVLSASPILADGQGNFIVNDTVTFGQAVNTSAQINVVSDITGTADITALGEGSYVALVAPSVNHSGTINVNGAAALVAAEAATITFRPSGLFDITVNVGSNGGVDNYGVFIDGSITGPASSGVGDNHRVYAVAVPKNDILTMTIAAGASLGFDIAGAAQSFGNTVVLSAGHDVSFGSTGAVSAAAGPAGNIEVVDASFTSAVDSASSGQTFYSSFSALDFASDLFAEAGTTVWLSTQSDGATIDVNGDVFLNATRFATTDGQAVTGGTAALFTSAPNGVITINGNVALGADGYGGSSSTTGVNGGIGTGGQATVQAGTGGQILINGSLTATADGYGGTAFLAGTDSGLGRGGLTRVETIGTGAGITVNGNLYASAQGHGGSAGDPGVDGGNAQGGIVYVRSIAANTSLAINGLTNIDASASGGSGLGIECFACDGAGGSATGGQAWFYVLGSGASLSATDAVSLTADGQGGSGQLNGGNGTGGQANITVSDLTSLSITGNVNQTADGLGGFSTGANGGAALGGSSYFGSSGSATTGATTTVTGNVSVSGNAFGGSTDAGAGLGGNASGGSARQFFNHGTTSISGDAGAFASATGGFSYDADGGTATGGNASIISDVALTILGGATAIATAEGGDGATTGGDALGGTAAIQVRNGAPFSASSASIYAEGYGGDGNAGGNGQGGNATLSSLGDMNILTNVYVTSSGYGGFAFNGAAGGGSGGDSFLYAEAGSLTVSGFTGVYADGRGGAATEPGTTSGNGTGGLASLFANPNGTVLLDGALFASANGTGGNTESLGVNGGNGVGGAARAQANGTNASFTVDGLAQLHANGTAGFPIECTQCGGIGGNGFGGDVWADAFNASTATLTFNSGLDMQAIGTGGIGVTGASGNGVGGDTLLQASAGATVTVLGEAFMAAFGFGGETFFESGGIGGTGTGGVSRIQTFLVGGLGGNISVGSAVLSAHGFGGNANEHANTTGGLGTGGHANIVSTGGNIAVTGSANVFASGFGGVANGGGGTGGSGQGGDAGIVTFADPPAPMSITLGSASVNAGGIGGDAVGGTGGSGLGGRAAVRANAGTILVQNALVVEGGAVGGSGDIGGNASAIVSPPTNEGLAIAAGVYANNGGSLQVNGPTFVSAASTGGNGVNGNGGSGSGGEVDIVAFVGTITLGDTTVVTTGFGGSGGNGGSGGIGQGGVIDVTFGLNEAGIDGTMTFGTTTLLAEGFGGDGGAGASGNAGGTGGAGGAGLGGSILYAASAAGGQLNSGALTVGAGGIGGDGGDGGNGDSFAGGNGGVGGQGTGGYIHVGTISTNLAPTSGGGATFTTVDASTDSLGGNGGDGGEGGGGFGSGGNGGGANGGQTNFLVRGVLVTADTVNLLANAAGGGGGFGAVDGNGGNATTGALYIESKDRFDFPDQRGTLIADAINGTAIATGGSGATAGTGTLIDSTVFRVLNGDATIGSVTINLAGDTLNTGFGPGIVSMRDGSATITGTFSFTTTGRLALDANNGSMTAGNLILSAGTFVPDPSNPAPTNAGTYLADAAAIATGGDFYTLANLDIAGGLVIDAPGAITAANISSGGIVDLTANSGNVVAGNLTAAGNIDASATVGSITLGTVGSTGGAVVMDSATTITTGAITAAGSVDLSAASISVGNVSAGGVVDLIAGGPASIVAGDLSGAGISLTSAGNITAGIIDSSLDVEILTNASVSTGAITAATDVLGRAGGGNFTTGAITAGGFIDIRATGLVDLGILDAGNYIDLRSNGGVAIGDAVSGETINFQTDGSVTSGNLTAGDSILAQAGGVVTLGNLSAGIVSPSTNPAAAYAVRLAPAGALTTGAIDAAGLVGLYSEATITTGDVGSGVGILALGDGNMTFGALTAPTDGYIYLADDSMAALGGTFDNFDRAAILAATPVQTSGSITINGAVTTGSFQAAAGTSLNFGAADADSMELLAGASITGGDVLLPGELLVTTSGGAISFGAIDAFAVELTSADSITTGAITVSDAVALLAATDMTTGNIDAFGDVSLNAGGGIVAGNVTASTIDLFAGSTIDTGDLTTELPLFLGQGIGIQAHVPGASVSFESGGDVTTGDITSFDGVFADVGGSLASGSITAGDFVWMTSVGNMVTGPISAFGYIDLTSTSGGITTDELATDKHIEILAAGDISILTATAAGYIELGSSGGGIATAAVTAGDSIELTAAGDVTTGNLSAGIVNPAEAGFYHIAIASTGGSIGTGTATALSDIGMAAFGDLSAGAIDTDSRFLGLAGGDMTLGSITTNVEGQVQLGDYSMAALGGAFDENYNVEPVFAATPTPTGGSITINGNVSTGLFRSAASDNFVSRGIDAFAIDAYAGGTAAIDGLWSAGAVTLASNDINMTTNGFIDTGANGSVTLQSINADGALIGDGLTGTGYALSNAEFGRISGGDITIVTGGYAGAAGNMTIGDLDIIGPLAGSNVENGEGGIDFVTLTESGQSLDGTLRIVGEVLATGFGAGNYLGFYTESFQLDAATGLLSISGTADELAGTLYLSATNIHVAEGSILDQLEIDPQYAGYQDDLNAPATVQRPDGVIRSANMDIEFGGADPGEIYTLYVQNTGTEDLPAGFLISDANLGDDGEGQAPPESIDLIINGQVVTPGGTLTGEAVRDLLVLDRDLTPFTDNSTINGCLLAGSCGGGPFAGGALPPGVELRPTEIPLIPTDPLGEIEFGNEPDIDDNLDGDESDAASPIEAPQPLFDTRPLSEQGDIDDPVSGTGNPALLGTPAGKGGKP